MPLTDRTIRSAKPTDKDQFLSDGHGLYLRRTFASRQADIGTHPHVIEKLLNHQMEGVMAVYNRADYWPERFAAQRAWGRKLSALRRKKTPEG